MFFDGWDDLVRLLVVGTCAYCGLLVFLRATGKRTLTKLNAFDLVVTVALGSTLATTLLSSQVSLSEGLLAFALLCALQYVVTFVSVRSRGFQRLIKAEPTLLYFGDRFLDDAMRSQRVTEVEIEAAVRAAGKGDLQDVQAVVLETDGSISVIGKIDGMPGTLATVAGVEHAAA